MKVAMYDVLPIDSLERYRQLADVTVHTRWRPAPPDADVVLVTHTRIPAATTAPVVLVSAATEVVQHLAGPVYRAPMWSTHAVAEWITTQLCQHADRGHRVIVAGEGRIAALVRRWCDRYWPADPIGAPGAVVLATPATGRPGAWNLLLQQLRDGVVVSVAHGAPITSGWLSAGLLSGQIRTAVVDVGYTDLEGQHGLLHTHHSAWSGHRSAERRQRVVEHVIRLAAADLLWTLRRVDTRAGQVVPLWR